MTPHRRGTKKKNNPIFAESLAEGRGIKQDYTKAIEWHEKAALQGHAKAQVLLGLCFAKGTGVEQNSTKAVECYEKAALQGYGPAQYLLGCCLEHGIGIKRDPAKAVELYEKAALQGDPVAQIKLAHCLENGIGVERDFVEALKWYKEAALQGNFDALERFEVLKQILDSSVKRNSKNTPLKKNTATNASSQQKMDKKPIAKSKNNTVTSNNSIQIKPPRNKKKSDDDIEKEHTPILLTSRGIKMNEKSLEKVNEAEKPLILTAEQKKKWDDSFNLLRQKYIGLEICWNEQPTDCTLSFLQESKWLLKSNKRKAKTHEITPDIKIKKFFFSRMKSYLNDKNIVSKLLPTNKNPSSLKVSCLGNTALTEWKDFNNTFLNSIVTNQI